MKYHSKWMAALGLMIIASIILAACAQPTPETLVETIVETVEIPVVEEAVIEDIDHGILGRTEPAIDTDQPVAPIHLRRDPPLCSTPPGVRNLKRERPQRPMIAPAPPRNRKEPTSSEPLTGRFHSTPRSGCANTAPWRFP